jgi:leucine dehydrogenase
VLVQGAGSVGGPLAEQLGREGATVIVADVDATRAQSVAAAAGGSTVEADAALELECDVYAPCALGATLSAVTIPRLRCRIVAGSANNQLAQPEAAELLHDSGILYAPDYVINAGGLINVADELEGYNEKRATKRVMRIYDSMKSIIAIAKRDGVPTHVAADTLALERIDAISSIERLHTGHPYGLERRRRETL